MAKGTNTIGKTLVWVIVLLLIVGLAGFGATNFGGSNQTVASVGKTEIDVNRYARALQQELRALEAQTGQPMTMVQAREFGLDQIVLQRLLAGAALEDEAASLGLSVGDEEVARSIRTMPAFQGLDGQFDRDAYEFSLDQVRMSASEFEHQIRGETSRAILQGALISAIKPPSIFVDTLYSYARETRDLTVIRFGADDLTEALPDPTDAQLTAYYDTNPEAFTLPRRKVITYGWLTPEAMAETIEIDEAAVQALYEQRSDEYNQPARRFVDRLVFASTEEAQTALDRVNSEEISFDDLVLERGLTATDAELGMVTREDLGQAAEPVFGLEDTGVTGPVETDLGPALFRVNAIMNAQETPFEEVADELRTEAALAAARRAVEAEIEPTEDLLAGGATIEDIAADTAFELGSLTWSAEGDPSDAEPITAYDVFREVALAAGPGDFVELNELSDGGLILIRVDEVLEPELQPQDAVAEDVRAGWIADAEAEAVLDLAEAAAESLKSGTETTDLGGTVTRPDAVLRDGFLPDLPRETVVRAFDMEEGAIEVLGDETGAIVLRLDAISVPGGGTDEAQAVQEGVRTAAGQGIAQDITSAFVSALEQDKGLSINSQAVNAVLAQFN
ncbi:peptidylprolyl isomerase [Palleronia caenipelagi]|uniref:Parvulin-like PPIase n=1 Tax=Palleronia caenipelagi TaxID=2489174 RepID=A0A547Q620_9RHOB|nr:peptidylprolyl isomerase [Palleronia caenipelagi]TRD21829.1 peptidylprolyl isomerase [Palleronia caenipelagi]